MVFIVVKDGAPVGQVAIYDIEGSSAEVGRFIAAPEARGTGTMKRAIGELLLAAQDRLSTRRATLRVLKNNQRAIGLYRTLGFQQIGEDDAMLSMALNLTSLARK
jgi:RimJ/RimL family protein N-acetyltransferase